MRSAGSIRTIDVPLKPTIRLVDRGAQPVRRAALWDADQHDVLMTFDGAVTRPILDDRRRIVLIDTVTLGEKPGTVFHWHLEGQGRLTLLRHYGRAASMKMEHLAFWLEEDLPPGGIDLIGIEPAETDDGEGISRSVRHRLPTICAQTAALLFRILIEEGW